MIQNIINKDVPSVRSQSSDIPVEVEAIASKALARNRENRFQSAREFRESIEAYLGLEKLNQATTNLKVLLEKSGTPQVFPDATFEKPAQKSKRGAAAVTGFVLIAAISALVIFKPSILENLRSSDQRGEVPVTQEATSTDEYQFDISELIQDDTLPPQDTVESTATQKETGHPVETQTRSNENIASAFTPAQQHQETPRQEPVPVPEKEKPKPAPRMGYLRIEARPSAEIYVDGVYKGDTPPEMSLKLTAGEHKIECRHPRYEDYTEVLKIVNGELSRRNVTLRTLKGIVSLATQEGAELYIDGKLVGVTPIRKPIELDSGPHMVTLKKTGFFTWLSLIHI